MTDMLGEILRPILARREQEEIAKRTRAVKPAPYPKEKGEGRQRELKARDTAFVGFAHFDVLRGTLDGLDVRTIGLSSRRVPGHARGVTDGSRAAIHPRRLLVLGHAEPRQATGLGRARNGQERDDSQGGTSERGEQHHRRCLHIEGFTPP
jgi:hypothetical protein